MRTNSFSNVDLPPRLSDGYPKTVCPFVEHQTNDREFAQTCSFVAAVWLVTDPRIRIGGVSEPRQGSPNITRECPCYLAKTGMFRTSSIEFASVGWLTRVMT